MGRVTSTVATGLVALATAGAGLVTITTAEAQGVSADRINAATINWGPCKDTALRKAKAQCGTLAVPLDHAKPNGRKVRLAVSRIKATAPTDQYQGPLVGGFRSTPADLLDPLPADVRATYDVVGIDARGMGDSLPRLDCGVDPWRAPQPAYQPVTGRQKAPGANEKAWLGRWDEFAAACVRRFGDDLEQYTIPTSARDVDAVRRALGAPTITYLSTSDSAIGQAYATLFPSHVRRMVFDSPFDPRTRGYPSTFEDNGTWQRAMERYFAWVATHDADYHLGRSAAKVEAAYHREERALTRRPLKEFGPAEWADAIVHSLVFDESAWAEATTGFAAWVKGDHKPLLAFSHDPATKVEKHLRAAGYTTRICTSGSWPRGYAKWRRDAFEAHESAPLGAFADVLNGLACRVWPVHQRPIPIGSAAAPAMLLIAGGDDTSRYRGALELRRLFPKSVLARVDDAITAPLFAKNACIDDAAIAYLRDGTLPERKAGKGPDATCAPLPLPTPVAAKAGTA